MSCADVVEVIVEQIVPTNGSLCGNHRVDVLLTIPHDVLATMCQIGVEHAFKFDTHHVTPFRFRGEVQQIGLGRPLHFRVGHPLAERLVWSISHQELVVDKNPMKPHVFRLSADRIA